MKPLCIYHGGCDDGFGAAYAMWKKYGDEAEYYPAAHGEAPPDVTGRDVVMVDFSYKRPIIIDMMEKATSILILDHHKTAKAELDGRWPEHVKIIFDMEHSGAYLAWKHFHPDTYMPTIIRYIEDMDMWWKKLPDVEYVSLAFRSYPHDFERMEFIVLCGESGIKQLVDEGKSIHRYFRTVVEDLKSRATMCELAGYIVPIANAPHNFASEVANELSVGYPFAAVFHVDNEAVRYSLRSSTDGIDVSAIAKTFGGGGHFHASGFESSDAVHILNLYPSTEK